MAVTIKDVAALAGVSPSTVSRTCNNHPSISRETKEKVRKAMAELGYETNLTAEAEKKAAYKTIGAILPPSDKEAFENPFYLEVIRGISQFCSSQKYITNVITGKSEEEILDVIRNLDDAEQISGYIVTYSRENDGIADYLYGSGQTYALIGKAYSNANQTIYIDNDNVLAGREAADYLCELGHKRIAYIGSESQMIFSADRKNGYILSLMSRGIEVNPKYCIELQSAAYDSEKIRGLLRMENRPTAIIVSDDIYGVTLERVCIEEGLRIPEDISIISFNNSLFARLTASQLTSIDINSVQLGIEAASQIINHIENPNLMATKIIVPHMLIKRNSCRRLGL